MVRRDELEDVRTRWGPRRRPSDDDVLQAACYPDVQRLCKDDIPDEKKITACRERKKAQISRKCTDAYREVEKGKR